MAAGIGIENKDVDVVIAKLIAVLEKIRSSKSNSGIKLP